MSDYCDSPVGVGRNPYIRRDSWDYYLDSSSRAFIIKRIAVIKEH